MKKNLELITYEMIGELMNKADSVSSDSVVCGYLSSPMYLNKDEGTIQGKCVINKSYCKHKTPVEQRPIYEQCPVYKTYVLNE